MCYIEKKILFFSMFNVLNMLIFLIFILISSESIFASDSIDLNSHKKITTTLKIKKMKNPSYISKEFFKKKIKCIPSCGVAIKGWYNAKDYCSQKNQILASKSQIKKAVSKNSKDDCLDCSYWTSSAFIPSLKKQKKNSSLKSKKYQKKEVYIYLNFENDFLTYSVDNVYIATCLSK